MFRGPNGAGKGDKPRPIKDREQFESNWDAIFKKKDTEACCNHDCNQGRDCPNRKEDDGNKDQKTE